MILFMDEFLNRWNIEIRNKKLYETAFSHSSFVNEHHLKHDYERLEFLGDAVLEVSVSDYLYKNVNLKEGEMTKLRASYVCENALYEYMKDLDLIKYIKVGNGELNEGDIKKAIVADTFESLMAVIYLEEGFSKVKEVILDIIVPYINNPNITFFNDYKSTLQEALQTNKRSFSYEIIDETGPAHDKRFTVVVKIDNIIYGKGIASSKKEAEREAARVALLKLAKNKNE
ncbi:MAG: ribonuclease III [Bacilli bacterium]|nr:ribonuclease III [Bacilli bacterium]